MNSPSVWAHAAGDRRRGLVWRDAVTARMIASARYQPYEGLVERSRQDLALREGATERLWAAWRTMDPWPDTRALSRLELPYAFVTNCSRQLATAAAKRSGLQPRFTLSAEEAGWYKPSPGIYQEAVQRLGSVPERTLLVAGSVHDANGGRRAGIRSVLVRRRAEQRSTDPGIAVVDSLVEVVDALQGHTKALDR